eukprot:scaffold520232_cov32-Prasinocladus_malaysianus.AAC.1
MAKIVDVHALMPAAAGPPTEVISVIRQQPGEMSDGSEDGSTPSSPSKQAVSAIYVDMPEEARNDLISESAWKRRLLFGIVFSLLFITCVLVGASLGFFLPKDDIAGDTYTRPTVAVEYSTAVGR